MMDVRAYCESCDRWLTCVIEQLDKIMCALCGQPPSRVEAQRLVRAETRRDLGREPR